jgi:hypothetical protein
MKMIIKMIIKIIIKNGAIAELEKWRKNLIKYFYVRRNIFGAFRSQYTNFENFSYVRLLSIFYLLENFSSI